MESGNAHRDKNPKNYGMLGRFIQINKDEAFTYRICIQARMGWARHNQTI